MIGAVTGRIRASDIDAVRSRVNIADVIGEQVTLKPAGVGSLKGLCPFHDERSPSFNVRPGVGRFHCFGCGEGGDVFTFIQKIDSVTFVDAVERLASRIGFPLTYEDGQAAADTSNRVRLLDANRAAAEFFAEQLGTPGAEPGRRFLAERKLDGEAAARFGVGWAPKSWDALTKHLRVRGYHDEELTAAGLVSSRDGGGSYDRFRGRLVWPIRDLSNAVVGFGARRLLEDDQGPKYLNTPETAIYHKAQVLYGLDLAKRDIGRARQVVVVEGYTDVMACHLAGVTTAVATCGTAFGTDHIKVLRRVLGDDSSTLGEVIFTFDPDAAGQKAAARAFAEERRFSAQTFVAVGADGLDPSDLRQHRGDAAVRQMIEAKRPMFEFMIRQVLDRHDLHTVEGRVSALRAAAPIVADIRDPALGPAYSRELAKWLAMEPSEVQAAVGAAQRRSAPSTDRRAPARAAASNGPPQRPDAQRGPSTQQIPVQQAADGRAVEAPPARRFTMRDLPRDASTRVEVGALMAIVQAPHLVGADLIRRGVTAGMTNRALAAVRDAVAAQRELGGAGWLERITEAAPDSLASFVEELAVAPIPSRARSDAEFTEVARGMVIALLDRDLNAQKADLVRQLQRVESSADSDEAQTIRLRLVAVEADRRALRTHVD